MLTWNASNLSKTSRELDLEHLLAAHTPDMAVITEAELPASDFTLAVKN